MKIYFSYRDLRAEGIPYSRQHLARLVRQGKLSRPLQRAPGCRHLFTEQHKAELLGLLSARKPEAASA